MRKALRFIAIIIALTSVLGVKADKKEHLSIVNGYFFKNVSPIFNDQGYPKDLQIFSIETPNGNRALGFYSPSIKITNEMNSLSISSDLIVEGGELLRRFNDFISREKIKREKGGESEKNRSRGFFPDFSSNRYFRENMVQQRC